MGVTMWVGTAFAFIVAPAAVMIGAEWCAENEARLPAWLRRFAGCEARAVERKALAQARYLERRAALALGAQFPDPRDQDQQDRGVLLKWRQRVARREVSPERVYGFYVPTLRGLEFHPTVRECLKGLPRYLCQ